MRRLRLALSIVSAAGTLGACGASSPPPAVPTPATSVPAASPSAASSRSSSPPARVTGRVGQRDLAPRSAIFLWRDRANDLTVLLSDADDPCAALTAGGWPRGATMLRATIKHNAADNRDAHFGAGDFPIRQGAARKPQDTKEAVFVALDASCSPLQRSKAVSGSVRLTSPDVTASGTAEGTFELTMEGGERLEGAFTARHCPTPDVEPSGCR